jgi:isoleucyl-tRNA synthetase
VPGVAVVVEKAVGTKCARSWKILPTVGDDPEYPDVSPRDAQALREWKALEQGRVAPVAPVPAQLRMVEAIATEPGPKISGQQDIEKQPLEVAVPSKRKSAKSGSTKTTGENTKRPAETKSAKKSGTTTSKKAPARKKAAAKKAAATKGAKKKPAKQKVAKKVTMKAAKKGAKKPKKASAAKAKKTKKAR